MFDANANPEKRFFIDLITRDISLEDAILDLIDNAIDALVRTKKIDLYKDFANGREAMQAGASLAEIRIDFSAKQFKIQDNCGGISFEAAKNDIFRFGHPDSQKGPSLSVFGIGMKRAIFKIGRDIQIESQAADDGFYMSQPLLVNDWLKDQSTEWTIPIERKPAALSLADIGTTIYIRQLRREVATLTTDPTFQNKVTRTIQRTYPFYLGKYVKIVVNQRTIEPEDLSFAASQDVQPAIEKWEDGNVQALLICGFLPRENGKWSYEKSGWYLLCNGRIIVYADKTDLTGWGWQGLLPQFMPKNRGFLGIVFFKSDEPEELPWNTIKRGINKESPVYIRTLKRMVAASRLVTGKQSKMYESNDNSEPRDEYRDAVKDLEIDSATRHAAETSMMSEPRSQTFLFTARSEPRIQVTSVQYKVPIADLRRAKSRLGNTHMSNSEAGAQIFKYFMDRECSS
jgi:hypothetical protein